MRASWAPRMGARPDNDHALCLFSPNAVRSRASTLMVRRSRQMSRVHPLGRGNFGAQQARAALDGDEMGVRVPEGAESTRCGASANGLVGGQNQSHGIQGWLSADRFTASGNHVCAAPRLTMRTQFVAANGQQNRCRIQSRRRTADSENSRRAALQRQRGQGSKPEVVPWLGERSMPDRIVSQRSQNERLRSGNLSRESLRLLFFYCSRQPARYRPAARRPS